MIKRWNNFINESVSEKELSDIKSQVEDFIGDVEINKIISSSVFKEVMDSIIKYAEYRYDETSKKIANWYKERFDEFEGWVGANWESKSKRKTYGDKTEIISTAIDFYLLVKDEFELSNGGYLYPKITELSKDIEDIATGSLDELEFYEVFENYTNVVIRIGVGDDIDVYKLDVMANELIPMCKRIEETLNLKNNGIDFDTDDNSQLTEIILGFI